MGYLEPACDLQNVFVCPRPVLLQRCNAIYKKERKKEKLSHAKHYIKTYCFVTWTGSSDLKLYMYLSRNVLLGTICDSRVTREG